MDTLRVSIVYRPLRVCWAIKEDDKDSFRQAVRANHALWGGRFNPIVVVDRPEEACAIVDAFRADIVFPVGDSADVKAFADRFGHLISPFMRGGAFVGKGDDAHAQLLDIDNAIASRIETPGWKALKEAKPRLFRWDAHDPLTDVFLMHFGAYPNKEEVGIDYEHLFKEGLNAEETEIPLGAVLNEIHLGSPSIAYLSRHGLTAHYSIRSEFNWPGFFIGDASCLADLLAFWNLRACDVSLLFVDRSQIERYAAEIPEWKKHTAELMSQRRFREDHQYAIWWRREADEGKDKFKEMHALIGDESCLMCGIDQWTWSGRSLTAPLMHFGESTSLGVLVDETAKPKLSFGLNDRPHATDVWFHTQKLVASVAFFGGLFGREDFTLEPPYVPELNEFYARTMHFLYDHLRIEPERIGLVIDAHDTDSFIYALPTGDLFKHLFALAGFDAETSSGGLITRQLISRLGGLQGGRVFKIPGARRLIKAHGPQKSFTNKTAIDLITSSDPDNPEAKFSDHQNLYLEPRSPGESLKPADVFAYLVNNGLFRVGADLACPSCKLPTWLPVDDLRERITCPICGQPFTTTLQLISSGWAFRRSGILGVERNAQGAVPVVLTLQQLDANLGLSSERQAYSVSLDLRPTKGQLDHPCEVDFAICIPRPYHERTIIIVGECKDRGQGQGADGGSINANDIANLRVVADSFPKERFEVFILLAKLCPFTKEEVELAKSLNGPYQCRVIMLTDRELEPYHLYERTEKLFKIDRYGSRPSTLAKATVNVFLDPQPVDHPGEDDRTSGQEVPC